MTQTVDDGKTTPNLTIECENEYFGVNCSSSPCKTKGYERKCHQKCEFTMYRFKWQLHPQMLNLFSSLVEHIKTKRTILMIKKNYISKMNMYSVFIFGLYIGGCN